jgi:hypothetical protein
MSDDREVLATISASAPRRWLAVACLLGLAFLLIYIAFARPPALGWQVFLVVLGGGALWVAERMRQVTRRTIELTETELRDTSGAVLARVEEIEGIDRGFFAFKPSNGFLIRTKAPSGPRVWNPGLWWRLGRQIGVGGVTPGSQTKIVSDILQGLIATRDDRA